MWVYHAIQYGNPLFNVNTTHIMWLDNWPSRFTFSPQELPTFGTYVRTHSMSQAVGRFANGLYRAPRQWYHASHPFWSPDQPGPWLIWACWGACVLLFIGVTYRALQRWHARRGWFLFSLTTIALFYLSFAWYTPVDDSPRFVLPMIPIVYIALFWFLQEMSASFPCLRRWVPRGLVVASTIAAGVYVGWHVADLNQWAQMPAHDRRQNEGSVRFMDVLLDRAGAGDAVVLGPTLALADWLAFDRQILPIPYVRQDWRSFSTWMVEKGVRHVVLDYESWDLRRPLLAQYWDFKDGLAASELPAGWELVYPPSFPCNPCLFAFDGQSVVSLEPEHTTDVRYGDAFTLLGYDVVSPSSPAGQGESVVLYWRATAPVEDDIHVFVHLLDDQGNLAGQHDSVMAGGRLPARTLMAGMIVRDPHPLPDLARDTYTLYVGMYRWETMERLPAVQQGRLVPDGYPQVGQVTLDATGITVHERE